MVARAVVPVLSDLRAHEETQLRWPTTNAQPTRLQVATMRPEDSGRGIARLPRAADDRARPRRGRRHRADRQARHRRRARSAPIPRTRGSTSSASTACSAPMPRSARATSSTIRKAESKPAQRVVFAPAQKNLRLQGSAQALKRSFGMKPLTAGDVVATTGQQQIQRGDIPPELRQMLTAPALRAPGDPPDRRLDRAQGHRPYRRQYRGRAAPRIYRGQGDAPRRRHL